MIEDLTVKKDNIKFYLMKDFYLNKEKVLKKKIIAKFLTLKSTKDFILFDFHLSAIMDKDERQKFYNKNMDDVIEKDIIRILDSNLDLFLHKESIVNILDDQPYIQLLETYNINITDNVNTIKDIDLVTQIFKISSHIDDDKYHILKPYKKLYDLQLFLFKQYNLNELDSYDFYHQKSVVTYFENELFHMKKFDFFM